MLTIHKEIYGLIVNGKESGKWKLNVEKCKVIQFGRTNNRDKYYMEDTSGKWSELSNSVTERDLGIMVSEDLSWELQIDNVVKKANRILGC